MKRHCIMLIAAAALATACGESKNIAGPSPTIGDTFAAADGALTKLSTRFSPGPNSCPDGDYPRHLWAHENGHGGVRLMWEEVLNIPTYIVESERMNGVNVYELELSTSTSERFVDAPVAGGRHRFRVRTKNLCDRLGPWSEYEYYSTDFDNSSPIPSLKTPPPPPPDDGDDDDDGWYGDGGDNDGYGHDNDGHGHGHDNDHNHGGGGNSGNNPCHLGPTANGDGDNNDHGGSDHNDDGHTDCGRGHGNH